MSGCGDEGVAQLLAGLSPRVRQLRLPGKGITALGAAAIGAAIGTADSGVHTLNLERNHLGDRGALALAGTLSKAAALTSLALGDNRIGADGLASLLKTLQSHRLLALDLGNALLDGRRHNRFRKSETAVCALAQLVTESSITDLNLRGCGLDESSEEPLVSALKASGGRIVSLDVSSNRFGAAAAPLAIAAMAHATTEAAPLQLVLANVGLDDSSAVVLAQQVQECGCTKRRLLLLDLFDNPVGDVGAIALLKAVSICTQKTAHHQLEQQRVLPVERLDLGCTNISDASANALLSVLNGSLPTLRAIGLSLTDLSAELLHKLNEQSSDAQRGHQPVSVHVDVRGTAASMDEARVQHGKAETGCQPWTDAAASAGLLGCHPLCDHRTGVFRLWLLDTFGSSYLQARDVVDIAGGRGLLAYSLLHCHAIKTTLIEPRTTSSLGAGTSVDSGMSVDENDRWSYCRAALQEGCKFEVELCPRAVQESPTGDNLALELQPEPESEPELDFASVPSNLQIPALALVQAQKSAVDGGAHYREEGNGATQLHRDHMSVKALLRSAPRPVLLGLHACAATEAIVDCGLSARLPFAVVPCCAPYGESGGYDAFVQRLMAKAPDGILNRASLESRAAGDFGPYDTVIWYTGET